MMAIFLLAILLISLALLAVTLQKAYFYVPTKELKFRAGRGDKISAALASVAVRGSEVQLLIAISVVLFTTLGMVLFAQLAPLALGLVVVALVLALGFFWQPRTRLTKTEAELAVWSAPVIVWLAAHLQPLLRPLTLWAQKRRVYQRHTKLFDADDLEAFLERQRAQRDNRISDAEMDHMQRSLKFGRRLVGDAMTPRPQVKAVAASDPLNPVLVDELHRTGHAQFPVYDGKRSNIVGTLSMEAIADVKLHGTVEDNADHKLAYVHQRDTLEQAMRAFYETRRHLFVVLNTKGDYTGILTLSDILQALAGRLEHQTFGRYDDREAVASRHPAEESTSANQTEVIE